MTRKEFENVFESLSLTPDFMINMERKLSAAPSTETDATESENTASGVDRIETVRRSRIFSRIGAAAAGIAIMAGGVGIAARMSEAPDKEPSSHGFAVTEKENHSSEYIINGIDVLTHPNPLTLINEAEMSEEQLEKIVRCAISKAEYYSYYYFVPDIYIPNEYYRMNTDDAIENGFAIFPSIDNPSDFLYFLIPDKTKDDLINDMNQFFTEDYQSNFDKLIKEHNGKLYACTSKAIYSTHKASDIELLNRTESTLSFEVRYDLTDIAEELNSNMYETPDMVKDLPKGDYTMTMVYTLKKTENGWRFSEYDPYKLVVEKFQEKLYEQLNGTQ